MAAQIRATSQEPVLIKSLLKDLPRASYFVMKEETQLCTFQVWKRVEFWQEDRGRVENILTYSNVLLCGSGRWSR